MSPAHIRSYPRASARDTFIRANTLEKFRPVRAVRPELVLEPGFEGIQESSRHKSGIAVRFPRILWARPDKTAAGADSLEHVRSLLATADDGTRENSNHE
jgi:DNA ligase-1